MHICSYFAMFLGGPSAAVHSMHGNICSYSENYNAYVRFTWMHACRRCTDVFAAWQSRELTLLWFLY